MTQRRSRRPVKLESTIAPGARSSDYSPNRGVMWMAALILTAVLPLNLSAQQINRTYESADGQFRLFVQETGEESTFTLVEQLAIIPTDCEQKSSQSFLCSGPQGETLRLEPGSASIMVDDGRSPLELPLLADESASHVAVFRDAIDESTVAEAALTSAPNGMSMIFSMWEIVISDSPTEISPGVFVVGNADASSGSTDAFQVRPTDGSMLVTVGNEARELERLVREPAPADVASSERRFGDYRAEGTPDEAYSSWYGADRLASSSTALERLRVTERLRLDLNDRDVGPLSTDGRLVVTFGEDGSQPEVLDAFTGDVETAVPFDRESAAYSFRWSPNGSRAIFSGDYFKRLRDADLYYYDHERRSIGTLTSDGFDGRAYRAPEGVFLDLTPEWIGGSMVVYQRTSRDLEAVLTIYDLKRRRTRPIVALSGRMVMGLVRFVPLTGELLLGYYEEPESSLNGAWVLEPGSDAPSQISVADAPSDTVLVDVSFDGRYLLMHVLGTSEESDSTERRYFVYDRQMGTRAPVVPPRHGPSWISAAAFSPDGARLLYAYDPPESHDTVVAVRDLSDESRQHELLTDALVMPSPAPLYGGRSIYWGTNDRILIQTGRGQEAELFKLR